MTTTQHREVVGGEQPALTARRESAADKIFLGLSGTSASLILVTLAAVATFLLVEAWPALTDTGGALADRVQWIKPETGESLIEIIGFLVFGTVVISTIALLIA
ncbi:MAG: phosphate ABC transporter permease subunit PstC, partial [Actinobacteria bacterium HGW-Actinobacteria-8]